MGANPARGSSRLGFTLAAPGQATLEVFDHAGRRIARLAHDTLPAGSHERVWNHRGTDARSIAPGVYFARLRTARGAWTVRWVVAG